MKLYFKIIVLLILSFFPLNIYAYELTCDNNSLTTGSSFSCSITGEQESYSKLSGTVTTDDLLSCEIASIASGLEKSVDSNNTHFDLTGIATDTKLVEFSCKVTGSPSEAVNARVSVEDFTYNILNSGADERSEILRSDYLKIEPSNEEEPNDTKPRDISDPSVRPRRITSPDLNITFSQFITEYHVEVLFEVEEIRFDYELNDQTSNLRIDGNTKLQVGNNVIDIYITTADGSKEACYTFYVERLARGEEIYYKESDSSLTSMVIPGYSIGFDKNIFEYKIHLSSDVDSININTTPTYENATVSISQTDNLKNGTVIAVEVTSADETSKTTYKINVTKDAPKKDYSSLIITVLLGGAFIGAIILFILTSQKKKDDPLLKLKKDKRKVNKGKKFDTSTVPSTEVPTEVQNVDSPENQANTTINLNASNTVAPIQTDKVVLDSFNQASGVNATIDLTTNVAPTPIQPVTPQNTQVPVSANSEQVTNYNVIQNNTGIAEFQPQQTVNNNPINQQTQGVQLGNQSGLEQLNNQEQPNNQNINQ